MPNTIAQNLTRLANAKEAIAEAIEEKGVTLGEDDGFEDFADAIMEISGGGTVETKVKLLKSIKSVGNSVIMTDIIPQFTDEVHMTVQFSGERQSTSSTDCFFGVQGADPWFLAANPSDTNVTLFVGYDYTKNPAVLNQGISINQAIPLVIRRNGKCICGGVSSVITSQITGDPHNFGCSFFGVSFSATNAGCFSYYNLTIYDAKIINSLGVTIHHLIPAEDQSTHRGGLYDLITGIFYPSDSRYDDLIKETGAINLPSVDITYPVQKMHYVQVFNSSDSNINYDKELNTDGTLNTLNSWYTSDYIDTLGASQIIKKIYSGQRICFYDGSKNFISYSDISTDGTINIPTNAKYFRFNGQTSAISTDMILLYFPNGYPDIPLSNSLISKTITQNGTYSALEDDAIGYSAVTVNVPSLSTMDKIVFSTDTVPIATWLYYPLSAADIDVTCYGVLAAPHHSYGGNKEIILLNIPYALSNGNDPAFYSPDYSLDLYATVYGNNELISGISVADYHVYTISVNSSTKKARFYVDDVCCLEKTFVHSGNVVCLGCGDAPDGRTYNGRRLLCKYLGVVESLQSDADIIAKQQELMEKYNIT